MDTISVIQDTNRPTKKRARENDSTEEEESPLQKITQMTADRRLLLLTIKQLIDNNPKAWEETRELAYSEYAKLSDDELGELKELLEGCCGLTGPYDNSQALCQLIGFGMEMGLHAENAASMLSQNYDIVKMVDSLMPKWLRKFSKYSNLFNTFIQIIFPPPRKENLSRKFNGSTTILDPFPPQKPTKETQNDTPSPPSTPIPTPPSDGKPDKIVIDPPSDPSLNNRPERRRKNNNHGPNNKTN